MKNVLYAIIVLVCIFISDACQKAVSYPAVPKIDFKSCQISDARDTLGNPIKDVEILLGFVDGDGDLFSSDTAFKSLILTFYNKVNGVFIQIPDSVLYSSPKVYLGYSSVMDRNGQNKTQKGTIKYDYSFYYPMPYDTVELELYLKDLAGNKSNTIKTPEIPLK